MSLVMNADPAIKVQTHINETQLQDFSKQAEHYITKHCALLSSYDQQLLANLIYNSCIVTSHDSYVRTLIPKLVALTSKMRNDINNYTPIDNSHATLTALTQALYTAVQEQQKAYKIWQCCTRYLDTFDSTAPLAQAITEWKLVMQAILIEHANTHKQKFNTALTQCSQLARQAADSCEVVANTWEDLGNNTLALDVDPQEQSVAAVSLASHALTLIDKEHQKLLDSATSITLQENDMQKISYDVTKLYYHHLWHALQKLDAKYKTLLFNEHGMITEDQRTEQLPQIPLQEYNP